MSKVETCRSCNVILTHENAWVNRTKGTLQSGCKACQSKYRNDWIILNKEKELKRRREYYQNNKEQVKNSGEKARLKRKYGLSKEDLNRMKETQGNICAICKINIATHIDHCHKSNKVRKILCNACNCGIGHFNENIDTMRSAIHYLETHNSEV